MLKERKKRKVDAFRHHDGSLCTQKQPETLTVVAALCNAGLVDVLRNHRLHAVCMQCSEEDEIDSAKAGRLSAQEVAARFSLITISNESFRTAWVSRFRRRYRVRCSRSCSSCALQQSGAISCIRAVQLSSSIPAEAEGSSFSSCVLLVLPFTVCTSEEVDGPSAFDGTTAVPLMREIALLCRKE